MSTKRRAQISVGCYVFCLPVLLGAHERGDDDVPPGLDAAVRTEKHPVPELVVKKRAVDLREALFFFVVFIFDFFYCARESAVLFRGGGTTQGRGEEVATMTTATASTRATRTTRTTTMKASSISSINNRKHKRHSQQQQPTTKLDAPVPTASRRA